MTNPSITDAVLSQSFSVGSADFEVMLIDEGRMRLILLNDTPDSIEKDGLQEIRNLILALLNSYIEVIKEREHDR